MNATPAISISRILWVGAGLVALATAGMVLYLYDPTTAGFYPVCTVHRLTGLECPGCGSLRALHQLAHGNIVAAWHFNSLLIAVLPMGVWLGLRETVRWVFGWSWPGIFNRPIVGWTMVVATIVFGIVRNIP
jgi:hypothetical protein